MRPTRRTVLRGCAAIALASLTPAAQALPARVRAPRRACHHTGCRLHRPQEDGPGICGLSLRGPIVLPDEEAL